MEIPKDDELYAGIEVTGESITCECGAVLHWMHDPTGVWFDGMVVSSIHEQNGCEYSGRAYSDLEHEMFGWDGFPEDIELMQEALDEWHREAHLDIDRKNLQ